MMQAKDWLSGLVGGIIGAFGLLPFLNSIGRGPEWFALPWLPVEIFAYILAAGGFYLVINSFIELTMSNVIAPFSLIIAGLITATGILKVLGERGVVSGFLAIGWMSPLFYYFTFMILGLFLVIATFAMEL